MLAMGRSRRILVCSVAVIALLMYLIHSVLYGEKKCQQGGRDVDCVVRLSDSVWQQGDPDNVRRPRGDILTNMDKFKISSNSPKLQVSDRQQIETSNKQEAHDSLRALNPGDNGSVSMEACPGLMRPQFEKEPQKWQLVEDRKVMVFSAYVERRKEAGGPAIRVIASGWQAQFNDIGDLYCQLWFDGQHEAVSIGPVVYERIYPSIAHHSMYVAHFIMCPLRAESKLHVPYAVSITASPCQKPTNALQVLGRKSVEPKNTHALCISPIYNGYKNWSTLIEMFEMHKIIGASDIVIYERGAGHESHNVLKFYNEDPDSKVDVVQWPFPAHDVQSSYSCQRGALNDCFYRMASRGHRYITVTDLDEILVPRLTHDWPTLLARINKPNIGAFLFQHAYFRRNSTGEKPYLISQQSLWRTHEVTPPGKIRCKAMYKSDLCLSIDVHFPFALTPGAVEYILDPDEGILHHYRYEPMETMKKHPERYHYIEDGFMLKYKQELTSRYNSISKRIAITHM